jgi:hypothetical protein
MEQVIQKLMKQEKSWNYIKQLRNEEGAKLEYIEWEDETVTVEYHLKGELQARFPMQDKRQGKMMYGIYKRIILGEQI